MSNPQTQGEVVNLSTDVPSDAAKVLRRRVYDALDEAYDEKAKRYRAKLNGKFTDQTIADGLGCSVKLVEKIREEFFGPAGDSEPVEQIKALQISIAHLEKRSAEMSDMAKGLGVQIKEHQQQVRVVKDDLKRLCQDFGWGH